MSETPLNIYLTHYSDTLISLSERTTLPKALNADLFISLHYNHSDNPNARGIEVYVADTASEYSKDATWLAFQLQAEFKNQLGFEIRGVKFANFQVLQETVGDCPPVLLEMGFLSNWDESEYYIKPKSIKAFAYVILKNLIKNFNGYYLGVEVFRNIKDIMAVVSSLVFSLFKINDEK